VEAASPATQAPPASGRDVAARVQPASTGGPAIIRVKPQEGPDHDGSIVLRDPSTLGGNQRFAHLPDRALIEESEAGPLPARGSDGRRPFDVYARPWSGVAGARIAILIGGLGLS